MSIQVQNKLGLCSVKHGLLFRLAQILMQEEQQLLDEIHVETQEERFQKNRERLKLLQEKHEKERLEEVEMRREQQFK